MKAYGAIHVLVNNAGITRDTLAMRMKDDDWDAVLDTNLKAVFRLSRAVIRPMMKQRYGRITGVAADGSGLRTAVDGDGFAVGPLGLPPGMGQARQERAQQREHDKKDASHDRVLRKARRERQEMKEMEIRGCGNQ